MEPFTGLGPREIESALERGIALADQEIEGVVAAGRAGDTTDVLRRLVLTARHARSAYGRSAALWAVHPDPATREAASAALSRFEAWQAATFARADLYGAIATLDDANLTPADRRHLELWRDSCRIHGAHLDDASREAMRIELERASRLARGIDDRFMSEVPILELTLEELDGLPAALLDTLEPGEATGTRRLRVELATRDAVLDNVTRRDVRERFWRTLMDRSLQTNLEPMRELFEVRRRIAELAGFPSWAALRTSASSMRTVEAAESMLHGLESPAHGATAAFVDACTSAIGLHDGDDGIGPWDMGVAIAELGRGLGVDAEAMRRFLLLGAVLDGLFRLTREVFGIRVEERPGGLGWHDDVRTLALIDDASNEQIGTILFDPYARDGKLASTTAFMDLLEADAAGPDGVLPPAVTMLVLTVPKPVDAGQPLLAIGDVDALFHEFGHVLDFTIGSRQSPVFDDVWWGTDWVEGPSFSIGYWARKPEVLATYARDPNTGETIPPAAVTALEALQGLDNLPYLERYIGLGRLDLAVHGPKPVDLDEAAREAWAPIPIPKAADHFQPFNFIMGVSGYDGALYGIAYAMVIRDAILDTFAREGWRNPETGRRYIREVLVPGPFVPPLQRLEAFLGRELTSEPLLAGVAQALEAARTAMGAASGS
jgi:Zn-dependent oligopeptidase